MLYNNAASDLYSYKGGHHIRLSVAVGNADWTGSYSRARF